MDSIADFLRTGMLQRLVYQQQKIRHLLAAQVVDRAPSQLKDDVFLELNLAFLSEHSEKFKISS